MGLQVRLRHALGEKLVDLADRPAERPLVVGRAREADVKIPSVAVAPEHCALFVHEGQWVLQDTSGGATFVNGAGLEGPTPLCIGDVIVLGTDASPASIEVDPGRAAQGYTGHPAVSSAPAPQPARAATAQAPGPRAQAVSYASAPPPVAPQPAYTEDAWGNQQPAQEDPFAAWQQPAATAASGQEGAAPVRKKKAAKKTSEGALIGGIAACLLIGGGTAWFAYHQTHLPEAVVEKPKPPAQKYVPKNIFDFGNGQPTDEPTPPPKSSQKPSRSTTPPPSDDSSSSAKQPANTDSTDSASPPPPAPSSTVGHKDEKAWGDVVTASYSDDLGHAIVKFEDYLRQYPGDSTREVNGYIDDAFDRLWWKRIGGLCVKKETLTKDLRTKDKDLRDQPAGDFRKTLLEEKKKLEVAMKQTNAALTDEMGYTGETPQTENKEMMNKLRSERDATRYGDWKKATLRYIRTNHGAIPWDGE